jgi:hypothetical protein
MCCRASVAARASMDGFWATTMQKIPSHRMTTPSSLAPAAS